MKIAINGSGVRRAEIELTECELKDLGYCVAKLDVQGWKGKASYGCTEVEIVTPPSQKEKP